MSRKMISSLVEFSTDTAHRRFSVTRRGDEFLLHMHTIWDADGSETETFICFPLEAMGPLAGVLHHALLIPPNVKDEAQATGAAR